MHTCMHTSASLLWEQKVVYMHSYVFIDAVHVDLLLTHTSNTYSRAYSPSGDLLVVPAQEVRHTCMQSCKRIYIFSHIVYAQSRRLHTHKHADRTYIIRRLHTHKHADRMYTVTQSIRMDMRSRSECVHLYFMRAYMGKTYIRLIWCESLLSPEYLCCSVVCTNKRVYSQIRAFEIHVHIGYIHVCRSTVGDSKQPLCANAERKLRPWLHPCLPSLARQQRPSSRCDVCACVRSCVCEQSGQSVDCVCVRAREHRD